MERERERKVNTACKEATHLNKHVVYLYLNLSN